MKKRTTTTKKKVTSSTKKSSSEQIREDRDTDHGKLPLIEEIVGTAQTPTALVGDTSSLEHKAPNEDTPGVPEKDAPVAEAGEIRAIDHIKPQFTHEQLRDALYWMLMIFEKASMTMVLIKDTGYSAWKDQPLKGDGIYVAARQLEWDSGSRHVIDTLAQYSEIKDNVITYVANNDVPVYVKVCDDDYCISSPDTKLYENEYVKLPNPFPRFEEVYGH